MSLKRSAAHAQMILRGPILLPGFVAAVISFWPTGVHAQFNISLQPQVAEVEVKPGGRGTIPFRVTNEDSERSLRISLTPRDIKQGAQGQYTLADTAMSYSCVTWLEIPDSIIEIPPGETMEIPVNIQVPFSARGGGYGAIVFEMLPETPGGPKGQPDVYGIDYRFQLPAWLEITVKTGRAARGRVTSGKIEVVPTGDDPKLKEAYGDRGMRISASVENTGNIHVFTAGRLIIRDEQRRLVRDTRLGSGRGAILPGASTQLETLMKLPPPGKYTVKTIIDYGGRSPAISQAAFEVTATRSAVAGESEVALPLWVEVNPDLFEPSIPADGFRVFGINVLNREEQSVAVDVGLGRIYFDENSQMWVSEEEADSGRSCAQWLTIEPRQFVLEPQRRMNVRVTLNVPAGSQGGYYSCVVLNTRAQSDSSASALPSPIYCPIYLTVPPGLEYAGEIVKVALDYPKPTALSLITEFRNTGNIHHAIAGGINLQKWIVPEEIPGVAVTDTARFEDVAAVFLETDSTYVLPGETRTISSQTVEGLPPGRYRAQVKVLYGGKTPASVEKEFTIKPDEQ